MSEPVIIVEGICKRYRLGQADIRHRTFRELAVDVVSAPLRKLRAADEGGAEGEDFWALKDINFEVQPGEVVGIIGRNGAGKSTLLKILSRITEPTKGRIRMRGRVASLLEVGTGFHPELTGRENIYLNGAILGMKRAEIAKKFDEIVAFAETEKFLDTPVKRYSSGMYVRLAFAVAAHLEPEILICDEVLAVGDGTFQKKCIGKMQEVSRQDGRTVLFVSHNMTAVKGLCQCACFLRAGEVVEIGPTEGIINRYISGGMENILRQEWVSPDVAPGNDEVRIKAVRITSPAGVNFLTSSPLDVEYQFWFRGMSATLNISTHIRNAMGEVVFNVCSTQECVSRGVIGGTMHIPGDFMNDGQYTLDFMVVREGRALYNLNPALTFSIDDARTNTVWFGKVPGTIRPTFLRFPLNQIAC